MRTSQELNDLISRMRNAMKNAAPDAPADRRVEMIPGMRYRGERGGMVTVIRCSQYRVVYQREGYSGVCEMSRREFDRKFTEVKS
ncbi:DUF4222 domain-containing protein [Lelliottia sp. V89_10]|uniref:DUF4222 domain-containing protein n=1 Tax=Lelliottia wanjuensis TaxID=3050585 RepID=UPI00249EFE39|nr:MULTISPECIES: DUF4222 domain-containing protein [unclassified Lelliottia]MDI3359743.1 DUF4222 domain-containing protein [Lelliottia sp. V89_13]MDK9548701.1 DUF4222 domain-containing protein [Lelliottia sp. V89_5]MDK9597333.1 DUF4222 domain-containing protein [Lelliottia sp. V89_10]